MQWISDTQYTAVESQKALKDLEDLGYDVPALKRRNMNDQQIVELRDKAYRYRGIQLQTPVVENGTKNNKTNDVGATVNSDLMIKTSATQEMDVVELIIYLAEKHLSDD